MRSSLDIGSSWQFDATYRHVGSIARQNVPSYGELDLRVAWRPTPTLEVSVVGQNLLHEQHAEFGALSAAVANTRNEIERSAYAKVVWRLR